MGQDMNGKLTFYNSQPLRQKTGCLCFPFYKAVMIKLIMPSQFNPVLCGRTEYILPSASEGWGRLLFTVVCLPIGAIPVSGPRFFLGVPYSLIPVPFLGVPANRVQGLNNLTDLCLRHYEIFFITLHRGGHK